jgi:branched-subunit amino acid aminotransferase/4-amino-4-deoxychorismate lyase
MHDSDQPQAYYNGRLIPAAEASVPVWDSGFVLGVTVAEVLRTFSGRLFRLESHLERLAHSLELVGIDPKLTLPELGRIAQDLASGNCRLLGPGDDLNLAMFFTPGSHPTMVSRGTSGGPTVCVHTFPIPFHLWNEKYVSGDSVVTTSVEQVSPKCWPRELKCRSRMHYYLADGQARAIDPGARALMVDQDGFVTEATTANILAYDPRQGLVGPPRAKVLPGVSLKFLLELAGRAGIAYSERDLTPVDIAAADEVLLASTSLCVVPVVRFNRKPVGNGKPGPIYQTLLSAWSQAVDVDIPEQAARFATR